MSIIVRMFSYFILQVTLLLSVLFLLRGHNHPGGGFIGALTASTGIGFYTLAYKKSPHLINKKQVLLINAGIACLLVSMLSPIFSNKNLLTGLWCKIHIFSYEFKLGTPLLFDIGIYFSILGSLVWVLSYLESEGYD